jgi:hypothetical protein
MKAYPFQHKSPTSGLTESSSGMDLRDWYAGLAMQGLLKVNRPTDIGVLREEWANEAYLLADAMLKARKT